MFPILHAVSFGWSDFARRYFRSLGWFPFLQVLRCFSSLRSLQLPMYSVDDDLYRPGFPIQISADQYLFTAPRSFSQCITSFFASDCQGIHQMPLPIAWFLQYRYFATYIHSTKNLFPFSFTEKLRLGIFLYLFPRFFDNIICFTYHTIQLFPYLQCLITILKRCFFWWR